MDHAEVTKAKEWVSGLVKRIRMEYGYAMAVEGLHPEVIIRVQQDVARGLIDFLEQ